MPELVAVLLVYALLSGVCGACIALDRVTWHPNDEWTYLLAGPLGVIALLLVPRTARREAQRRLALEKALQELRAAAPSPAAPAKPRLYPRAAANTEAGG